MNILFMCVANSARSQLAEGIAGNLFKENANIQSAGSRPSHVNPFAIQVLNEIGIDISSHTSKSINDLSSEFIQSLDYIVTLCVEEVCPLVITDAKKIHWPLLDPAGTGTDEEQLVRFRNTRDEIKKRLELFFRENGFSEN